MGFQAKLISSTEHKMVTFMEYFTDQNSGRIPGRYVKLNFRNARPDIEHHELAPGGLTQL